MKKYLWVFFLLLNFAALALGGLLQGEGAGSTWYRGLDTAPWTPP
jgi:tryptophan-rich sensory protein